MATVVAAQGQGMIYRCNVPLTTESGVRECGEPATHFDSRALPRRHLYCERHRATDDPPIQLIDMIRSDWTTEPNGNGEEKS